MAIHGEVLIAGSGLAASAAALRLLDIGIRCVLLRRTGPGLGGAESLPESVCAILAVLRADELLQRAKAVRQIGFENAWEDPEIVAGGTYLHVDRAQLANEALTLAMARGANVISCPSLPVLKENDEGVVVKLSGRNRKFCAAVDATGRAARWSRPVHRAGSQVADIYQLPHGSATARGRISRLSQGWCYRIGLPTTITVGIVRPFSPGERSMLDAEVRERLHLASVQASRLGRRPAFMQWCAAPMQGRRAAIGDAALAMDPRAGGGARFALASALAASAAIQSMLEERSGSLAEKYYCDFVASARLRHARFVDENKIPRGARPTSMSTQQASLTPGAGASGPSALPNRVRFAARIVPTELTIDGTIRSGEAIALPDGGRVRWLGQFDLMLMRKLSKHLMPLSDLVTLLQSNGITEKQALQIIAWCLDHEVLSSA